MYDPSGCGWRSRALPSVFYRDGSRSKSGRDRPLSLPDPPYDRLRTRYVIPTISTSASTIHAYQYPTTPAMTRRMKLGGPATRKNVWPRGRSERVSTARGYAAAQVAAF
jgi:hypothetical protein